jgi:hypothetical protein
MIFSFFGGPALEASWSHPTHCKSDSRTHAEGPIAMFNLIPILAAGGTTVSVLIALVSFAIWLWNQFNGNQNPPLAGGRPQPQPRRQDNELQNEIKRFLNNVMGQKQNPDEELEVLIVEEDEVKRRSRSKGRSKSESAKRKSEARTPAQETSEGPGEARPGGRISQRKGPGSTTLGSGVRQHVAEHMQEGRVIQQAQSHLAHGVAEKVQQDLGTFTGVDPAGAAATVTAARQTATAISVAKLMRDPVSLKEAFVLNLILNRPKLGQRK